MKAVFSARLCLAAFCFGYLVTAAAFGPLHPCSIHPETMNEGVCR